MLLLSPHWMWNGNKWEETHYVGRDLILKSTELLIPSKELSLSLVRILDSPELVQSTLYFTTLG